MDPNLRPYTKINSKEIKDLNVGAKTIIVSKENSKENVHDIVLDNDFLNIPKTGNKKKKRSWTS